MSPHERKVLATIEKELRNEDPALAATLGRTPSQPSPSFATARFPLSIRDVLLLLGALTGLIAVYTALAGRLGPAGLAALTAAAVVPWLVATAWSAERRSPAVGATDGASDRRDARDPDTSDGAAPPRAGRRVLLALVALLLVLSVVVPAWQPAIALGLLLLVAHLLPWLVVRVVERFERAVPGPRRPYRGSAQP